MSRYKLTVDSLVRQRQTRIIKGGSREALLLDEIILLRDQVDELNEALAQAKKPAKKKTDS